MSSALTLDTEVRRELWLSFGSMIRAYAGARNVANPASQLIVDDSRNNQILVTKPDKLLTLEYDPLEGEGSWTAFEGSPLPDTIFDQGPIRLELDGVMFYGAKRLEFDMAAIELLAAFDQGRKTEEGQGR